MSMPGPDIRWFDIGAIRADEKTRLKSMRVLGAVLMALLLLPGMILVFVEEGVNAMTVSFVALFAVFVLGPSVGFAVWNARKQREAGVGAGAGLGAATGDAKLGVGRDGIRVHKGTENTHFAWETLGGVRIHSVFSGGTQTIQTISLDLMGPTDPAMAGRVPIFNAGQVRYRVPLADAYGVQAMPSLQFATSVGHALQGYCPALWRGFTLDNGSGFVQFHSWNSPRIGFSMGMAPTPRQGNFGGGMIR